MKQGSSSRCDGTVCYRCRYNLYTATSQAPSLLCLRYVSVMLCRCLKWNISWFIVCVSTSQYTDMWCKAGCVVLALMKHQHHDCFYVPALILPPETKVRVHPRSCQSTPLNLEKLEWENIEGNRIKQQKTLSSLWWNVQKRYHPDVTCWWKSFLLWDECKRERTSQTHFTERLQEPWENTQTQAAKSATGVTTNKK